MSRASEARRTSTVETTRLGGSGCGRVNKHKSLKGIDRMSVTKIIEVVGRSSESSDAAVKNALSEASKNLRNVKACDVVSVGLRGDNLDEWGALVRISFLVENVTE